MTITISEYVWTGKLLIQKYPDTCGRGLKENHLIFQLHSFKISQIPSVRCQICHLRSVFLLLFFYPPWIMILLRVNRFFVIAQDLDEFPPFLFWPQTLHISGTHACAQPITACTITFRSANHACSVTAATIAT